MPFLEKIKNCLASVGPACPCRQCLRLLQPRRQGNQIPINILFVVALGLIWACGGSHKDSTSNPPPVQWTQTILPSNPILAAGQTVQFQASTSWGSQATWTVTPASAGTITALGLFTASGLPGSYTVTATGPQSLVASLSPGSLVTNLTILQSPAPAQTSPNLALASGASQTAAGFANAAVVGEVVPAITSTSADLTLVVRHGFQPPK